MTINILRKDKIYILVSGVSCKLTRMNNMTVWVYLKTPQINRN